jgi:hypothetical protein
VRAGSRFEPDEATLTTEVRRHHGTHVPLLLQHPRISIVVCLMACMLSRAPLLIISSSPPFNSFPLYLFSYDTSSHFLRTSLIQSSPSIPACHLQVEEMAHTIMLRE